MLRVLSDTQGGLCHLTLQYIDWLALQLLPDTAETEWLDRHGEIWLVNADGTTGRKQATFATGTVSFTGTNGTVVPIGTRLDRQRVELRDHRRDHHRHRRRPTRPCARSIPAASAIVETGDMPSLSIGIVAGVDSASTWSRSTAASTPRPTTTCARASCSASSNPPMGGAQDDYVTWALAVPGVTRAWAAPEQGLGTITVRFLMDDLRADDDGWPTPADIIAVKDYIDKMRPVTVKDCYVLAPIKQFIDITIAQPRAGHRRGRGRDRGKHSRHAVRDGGAGADDLRGMGFLRDHERARRAVLHIWSPPTTT